MLQDRSGEELFHAGFQLQGSRTEGTPDVVSCGDVVFCASVGEDVQPYFIGEMMMRRCF